VWQRRSGLRQRRSEESPVYFSVVEPGTTTLRLLVVEAAEAQATVLGWAEGPGWSSIGSDRRALATVCGDALADAEKMAQALGDRWMLPDQILVGLPVSQLRAQAWSITQRRSRPDRPVDERELRALLDRTLRLSVNRLRDLEGADGGWVLVDTAPVGFTIDGRGVTDPIGFRGREVGATVFAALARAEVIETWGLVARELEFTALTLAAAPLALATAMSTSQGILMDIGGRTTDLIWCRAGRPYMLVSLDSGGEALTDSLVRKWNRPADWAERLKRAYSRGDLPAEGMTEVQQVLWPGLQAWLEEAEAVMVRLNQDEALPQHLYLLGGGSALPEMTEAVRSLAWSQRLQFARYPQICRIQPTDVPGVVNRTSMGREMGDVSALALAAWIVRLREPPERPGQILNELVQG
jgi:cell division protein FtsA